MANPILKIKRNTNFTPTTQLINSELGVDLGLNKLYIGNTSNISVPIAALIDADISLGDNLSSDDKIPTQHAAKIYVDTRPMSPQTPKDVLLATISGQPLNNSSIIQNIDLSSAIIAQSANMNLQIDDPNTGSLTTGFFQTTKTEMHLNVNYSIQISSIDTNATSTEGVNIGYWRIAGIRVIDTKNPTNVYYYGMQASIPVIGDPTNPLPTLISGNASIRLPKYTSNVNQWEVQLVYQTRSVDQTLTAGDLTNGINDPILGTAKAIRIQITKLAETT